MQSFFGVAASMLRGGAAAQQRLLLSRSSLVGIVEKWGWLAVSSASPSLSRHGPWRFLRCVCICVIALAIMRTQDAARDLSGARRPTRHSGAGVVQS